MLYDDFTKDMLIFFVGTCFRNTLILFIFISTFKSTEPTLIKTFEYTILTQIKCKKKINNVVCLIQKY